MQKYTICTAHDLDWQSDPSRPGRCNVTIGLNTPSGFTTVKIDPGDTNIRKLTIEELEKLAIEKYLQGLI